MLLQQWRINCIPIARRNMLLYDSIVTLASHQSLYSSILTAGAGISIRVNDDGVAADHPDFSAKFDVASSCPGAYLPVVAPFNNTHGTTCAAIAAASANDACSTGIAPDASISSCLVFPDGTV